MINRIWGGFPPLSLQEDVMKYKYLIVSRYKKSDGTEGYNESDVNVDYKLNTTENIRQIKEVIKRYHNFESLIILNIMRLKK